MNNKVIITQSNYIPWKGYIDSFISADNVMLFDDMQYTKRDWRNRNLIVTQQGLKWLSIPVKVKGRFEQTIYNVEVTNNEWSEKHWNILYQNYKKAPFFSQLENQILQWYEKAQKMIFLNEINTHFLDRILEILSVKKTLLQSKDFNFCEGKSERLVDLCLQLNATHYLSGPKAKNYLDTNLFEKNNIQVIFSDYSSYKSYNQLQENFDHGVSILDLFFNLGVEGTKKHLKSINTI